MNMVTVVAALMLFGAAPQIEPCFGDRTFASLVKTSWPWGVGTVKIDGKVEAWPREGSALRVETERRATQDGFAESYRFRNVSPQRISLSEIDINTPFNDDYRGLGKDGGAGSCHAHVWPGGSSAWVCAMRMNGKPPHLGLVVTEGAITGYELKERALDKGMSNTRGLICLSPPDVVLEPGAEYVLSWRVFEHQGKDDFFRKLVDFGGVKVTADRWVVTKENPATVTFEWKGGRETRKIAYSHEGEIKVPFAYGNGKATHAELLGIADPMEHVLRRARFIVAHQQYLKEGDAYDGAFVPYDSETDRQHRRWIDGGTQDWAPGAERFGIGISLAMLVQRGYDEFREPLRRFARFAESLCHDGYVFADHMPDSRRRDFNTPWAACFFIEYGRLTGERRHFELAFRVMRDSYRRLGTLLLVESRERETIAALREAGLGSEADELQALFTAHKDAVLQSAGKLRTEEVCFAPECAAAHVTQFLDNYELTGKKAYLDYALAYSKSEFEACLGPQPSWHSHDIGLHHWDGYWFGKRKCWGDTLPHHWNGTGACAFAQLARLCNDPTLAMRASVIPLQLLGLIRPDGTAGCAFVYPDRVNGAPARFLDPLCNDQDWVMAYFLEICSPSRPCKLRKK